VLEGFGGDIEGRRYFEDPSVDRGIRLKLIFQEVGWGSMDWIDLAQDRDRWRALVNAVMNHRVP
jgi:hypothetical protein